MQMNIEATSQSERGWEGEEIIKTKMIKTEPVNVFCESPWGYIAGTQQ